jgi:UDP-N-acetylglucosamine 2-epimerase (non-hydrolysing)/UDP-GlcNAc3NAcA epimerase
MQKVVTVVGARPQFVKASAVSRVIRRDMTEVLIHTGQHYDQNMSEVFFEELSIPKPDYNIGIGSGSHAVQTGKILIALEEIYIKEKPDCVLVYGDTNTTLAAALAASKILIPVVHVEAGLRSFNKIMPEEQNRILTDHISDILFCSSDVAVQNLKAENIKNNVYCVGDVMCDAVRYYLAGNAAINDFKVRLKKLYPWNKELDTWYLATVHRAENTDNIDKLRTILKAFEELNNTVLLPVHPRIREYIDILMNENKYKNICFVEPLGYIDMLYFTNNSIKVVTDSGGLQKEAYLMHKNVVTLRNQTEWVETLEGRHNILSTINTDNIVSAILDNNIAEYFDDTIYGDGNASKRICKILKEKI